MIVEIALGIVLAVLILVFLPVILTAIVGVVSLALLVTAVCAVIFAVVVVGYFALQHHYAVAAAAAVFALIGSVFYLGHLIRGGSINTDLKALEQWIDRHPHADNILQLCVLVLAAVVWSLFAQLVGK